MRTILLLASFCAAVGLIGPRGSAQPQLQPLWSLAPGIRPYLPGSPGDNGQRGMAYNPVTGHVLLVNRTGGLSINILDGTTGADLGSLALGSGLIAGGTFAANMIGVGGDGAIYVGNLSLNSATTSFRLYRWSNEQALPTLAFDGTPAPGRSDGANNALRFGDTLDVRGAGAGTQVLLGSRGAAFVSILTTADGVSFSANLVQTDAAGVAANNGPFGLGLAFGAGDSFWGKSSGGTPLREIAFDLASSSGVTLRAIGAPTVSDNLRNLAYDAVNLPGGLLAAIDNVNHTVSLFDVSGTTPVLLDVELFPGSNANVNGTGAADFGGGKLFALDTNNGLVAYDIIPEPGTIGLLGAGLLLLARRRRH